MSLPATESFTGGAAVLPNPPWAPWSTGTVSTDGSGNGQPTDLISGIDGIAFWNPATDTFPNDQYSQVTLTSGMGGGGGGFNYLYLVVRASGVLASGSAYWFWTDGLTDTQLLKVVAGVSTTLATANTTTAASSDTFKLEVIGTTIKVYKNGSEIVALRTTDAAVSSGQPGMGGECHAGAAGVISWDNWIADGIFASPTINTQPVDQTVYRGQTATFSIAATASAGSLSYQWKKNGGNVGTNSNSYTTSATVDADDHAIITCDVTDSNGTTTSAGANLFVLMTANVAWFTA